MIMMKMVMIEKKKERYFISLIKKKVNLIHIGQVYHTRLIESTDLEMKKWFRKLDVFYLFFICYSVSHILISLLSSLPKKVFNNCFALGRHIQLIYGGFLKWPSFGGRHK